MNSEYDESGDTIIFTTTNVYEMSPLLSIMNAMILETCRDEVDLVNSSCRKVLNESQPITYMPIEKRFGFSDEVIFEQNMKIKLGSVWTDLTRLDRILTMLKDVLEYGISDLLQNKSYQMLYQAVEDISEMKMDEFKLFSTYENNYDMNNKLTEEAQTNKLEALGLIKDVENNIFHMKKHMEAFLQEAGVKYSTIVNWQKSRYEQNHYQQKLKERIQEQSIANKKKLMEDEKIANSEMHKFYVEYMKDLKADIVKWMTKYDEDLDAKDIAIMKQRIQVEEMQTQLKDLELKMQAREKEILDWIEKRDQLLLKALNEIIRKWATIKIQRWWRIIYQNILEKRKKASKKNRKKKKKKT
ncbi:uncharacterized protein LOC123672787 [Harmonia axyridis]|uniref:uncharacterized protein LOC123672787 n=1 Tax=Harmonia axyridis TaxID=115357 RepID=UPI001E276BBC|nr:uncharacterized protein LOC123672787 [Harmonia axyridis]